MTDARTKLDEAQKRVADDRARNAAARESAAVGAGAVAGAAGAAGAASGAGRPAGPTRGVSQGQRPAAARPATARKGARRVRLSVSKVDPWSVMKISFLLSVAIGIAFFVLTLALWLILSGMGVFSDVDRTLRELQTGSTDPFSIMDYIGLGRVLSLSIVIGVIDVILITAMSTLVAFLYNICASLVGGVQLTLTDD